MPNCTCETTSAWGCPMHAPKHMESELQKEIEGLKGQIEVARDYIRNVHGTDEEAAAFRMDPNECFDQFCKKAAREHGKELAADAEAARLWREVVPLLKNWKSFDSINSEAILWTWVQRNLPKEVANAE